MIAKSREWPLANASWKRCATLTKWPTSVLPACIGDSRKPPSLSVKSTNWSPIMIQLKPDCLIFQTSDGDQIPCSAEWVTLELMGEGASWIDPAIIHNASAGNFPMALKNVRRLFG